MCRRGFGFFAVVAFHGVGAAGFGVVDVAMLDQEDAAFTEAFDGAGKEAVGIACCVA